MSLGGTGLRDWMIQRYTAVYLAVYTLFLVGYTLQPHWTHEDWQFLFSHHWMQIGTLLALVSMALHAWIGLWVILTDYVKPVLLRTLFLGLIFVLLFSYFVWGVMILWG
jgi:succinate dehydrogenase / fumarate reductase membrane anchor subunit